MQVKQEYSAGSIDRFTNNNVNPILILIQKMCLVRARVPSFLGVQVITYLNFDELNYMHVLYCALPLE